MGLSKVSERAHEVEHREADCCSATKGCEQMSERVNKWATTQCHFWAADPKRPRAYAFTQRRFSHPSYSKSQPQGSNPSPEALIPASRLQSQPRGSNTSLKALILASRLQSQPWSSNPSLKALILALWLKSQPCGSNPSHEAQIPASWLKSLPPGLNP